MAVNAEKTKYIIFHARNKRVDPGDCNLVFNNNEPGQTLSNELIIPLTRVCDTNENEKSYKLLGVWFDEHLTFDTHVKNLCTKLTRALFFIRRAQHFLTDKTLVSLYYALFHSHLLYCPLIISSTSE